jgi:dTDP-glucose pyrophosphorylase
MNCWILPPEILIACHAIAPSPRGELELTHAISLAIERLEMRFRVLVSDEGVLDLSKRDDVAGVTARLSATSPRP